MQGTKKAGICLLDILLGGDEGDRTLDLSDANRTLSQLSYVPKTYFSIARFIPYFKFFYDDSKYISHRF